MKITLHWLREFVSANITAVELADRLTSQGLEVEAVEPVAPPFCGVIVGEILKVTQHPDADKLSVCEVTTDGSNLLQIICGAKNVRAGLKVAVAMVGAELPGKIIIKRAKLRGLESMGMLCSARELGLGSEHEGIMELPAGLPLSRDVREALDLDDSALEVNATPNRGDCMSVFGIARDYAAAHAHKFLKYEVSALAAQHSSVFPAVVEAADACPEFLSRVIRGVDGRARSPAWLKERLRRVGIGSISAIVDVTNFVMIELGQPLHAYDLNRLSGSITVRSARAGERITLLDDRQYALDAGFLVIADDSGPVGLAGIMGGRPTAISDSTTDVLLEAAHFAPHAVAGKARQLGLFTDAGQRFERGVDPGLPALVLERASALLVEIAGGTVGPVQRAEVRSAAHPDGQTTAPWVGLRRARLTKLLGAPVPDAEVLQVLKAISERVETTTEGWRLVRPPHRFDIRIEADLIEEVARLRGFDRIAERPALAPQQAGAASESQVTNDRLLFAMADQGYREIISYTFVDPSLQRRLFPNTAALALANPISAELSEMRISLWPGLVQAARENLRRQQTRVRLVEAGTKFEVREGNLCEIETLAGLACGARLPEQWGAQREALDYYDVKGDLDNVLALTGDVKSFRYTVATLGCLRPGRTARIMRGDLAVGWLGELHPQLTKELGLPSNTLVFELETVLAFHSKPAKLKAVSKYPSVRRDLAVVVDEAMPLAVLEETVTVSASGLLTELRVFDIYRGPGVDSGRKSVALGLILQDSSRTLTDVDADAVVTAVVARLRDDLSASIRDQ